MSLPDFGSNLARHNLRLSELYCSLSKYLITWKAICTFLLLNTFFAHIVNTCTSYNTGHSNKSPYNWISVTILVEAG